MVLILHRYENPGMLKAGSCNSDSCFYDSVIRFIHICKKRRNQTVTINVFRKHAAHEKKKLKFSKEPIILFPTLEKNAEPKTSPIFVSGKSNYK